MSGLQTAFTFTLPRGYVDPAGNVHREGVMRLATAMDEIAPLQDQRVHANQAYLSILLLARVITKLGTVPEINTSVIENLFAADLAYLQSLYRQLNEEGTSRVQVTCAKCEHKNELDLTRLGEL